MKTNVKMSGITNNAQVSLLHTILQAVEKYCVDPKGYKELTDSFEKPKINTQAEPPTSDHRNSKSSKRNSMSSTLFDYLNNDSSKKRDSVSSDLVEYLNDDDDNNIASFIKLLEVQKYTDDLSSSWDILSDFDDYERTSEEDIIEYVSTFDKKYQTLHKRGVTLPQEVLALKVLSKARLSKQERALMKQSIVFSKREGLYDEAKQALLGLAEYRDLKTGFRKLRREKSEQKCMPGRFYLILDSACSSTLCGKKWLDEYLEYLGEDMKKEVKGSPGEKSFIFGGGAAVKSLACCRIPAILAGKMVTVEVDVVPNDLPLIFSLVDMKKAQITLDFTSDTAEIFGQHINLKTTESGHYAVPIDGVTFRKRQFSQ